MEEIKKLCYNLITDIIAGIIIIVGISLLIDVKMERKYGLFDDRPHIEINVYPSDLMMDIME